MKNKEKISIIIPVYNVEQFLERCLNSIINQTYKNLEIICINDGSKDKSGIICDEFAKKDSRIKVLHQENKGASSARNLGLKNATGRYINFADADDWLEKEAIETLYKAIIEQNVDVVRGNYNKVISEENKIEIKLPKEFENNKIEGKDVIKLLDYAFSGKMMCSVWILLIKKELIDKLEPFNTDIQLMEDKIFYTDLLLNINKIYLMNTPIYNYVKNPNSIVRSPKRCRNNMIETLQVNEIILSKLKAHGEADEEERKKILSEGSYTVIKAISKNAYTPEKEEEIKKYVEEVFAMTEMQHISKYISTKNKDINELKKELLLNLAR